MTCQQEGRESQSNDSLTTLEAMACALVDIGRPLSLSVSLAAMPKSQIRQMASRIEEPSNGERFGKQEGTGSIQKRTTTGSSK